MQFLAPLIWMASIAVAIPIILHLTRKASKKPLLFSSLMFLRRIPVVEVRRRKLKHPLLLLLRCLGILLLVAAFARPVLEGLWNPALVAGENKSVVVLLDSSQSMAVPSVWEKALEAASERVSALQIGDEVMVVEFGSKGRPITPWERNPARILQVLSSDLVPTFESTDYSEALKKAAEVLDSASNESREIFLITDLQRVGLPGRGFSDLELDDDIAIELKKLAFADRDRWVADPDKADVPVDRLLDADYLRQRAQLVDPGHAAEAVAPGFGGSPDGSDEEMDDRGDTVYLTAVDRWGNAVSWIQSNFAGFGSGLLEPETGILLHNRGALYTLEEGHPNQVAPGKRPYHTLSPMMALHRDGSFAFTLGTPGGDSQPQSLIQIVNNVLIFGMTPQQAIEAPRFRSMGGVRVALENRVPLATAEGLVALGHDLNLIEGWTATFGGAQMIFWDAANGVLTAAADPRREAYALAY